MDRSRAAEFSAGKIPHPARQGESRAAGMGARPAATFPGNGAHSGQPLRVLRAPVRGLLRGGDYPAASGRSCLPRHAVSVFRVHGLHRLRRLCRGVPPATGGCSRRGQAITRHGDARSRRLPGLERRHLHELPVCLWPSGDQGRCPRSTVRQRGAV